MSFQCFLIIMPMSQSVHDSYKTSKINTKVSFGIDPTQSDIFLYFEMSFEIEGHFKNFYIRPPGEDELEKILKFLEDHYDYDEPLLKCLKREDVPTTKDSWSICDKLKKNLHLSLIALETKSREISGVLLNYKWTKEEAEVELKDKLKAPARKQLGPYENKHGEKFVRLAFKPAHIPYRVKNAVFDPMVQEKCGVFAANGFSEVVWNHVLATSSSCRHQGLASELMMRMIDLFRKYEIEASLGYFTDPWSRRAADKVGYGELARSYFKDATDDDVDGQPFFPDANDPEDFVGLMMLQM